MLHATVLSGLQRFPLDIIVLLCKIMLETRILKKTFSVIAVFNRNIFRNLFSTFAFFYFSFFSGAFYVKEEYEIHFFLYNNYLSSYSRLKIRLSRLGYIVSINLVELYLYRRTLIQQWWLQVGLVVTVVVVSNAGQVSLGQIPVAVKQVSYSYRNNKQESYVEKSLRQQYISISLQ